MDETLKTVRIIHFTLVMLCFAISVYLVSPKERDRYDAAASAVKSIIEQKIFRFSRDVGKMISDAVSKSDIQTKIGEYLRHAKIPVADSTINALKAPTIGHPGLALEEFHTLQIWSRIIDQEMDEPCKIFVPSGVIVMPEDIDRAKQLSLPSSAAFAINSSDSKTLELMLTYTMQNESPNKNTPRILVNVNGQFVPIPGTTLREWLRTKHLLRPPLFSAPNNGGAVTFLPGFEGIWREIFNKTPANAVDYLIDKSSQHRGRIKVFEVEIDQSMISLVIPALMLIMQLTLYLHVKHLHRLSQIDTSSNFHTYPWVGLFIDIPGRFYYCFSVVIWPFLVSIGLLHFIRETHVWISELLLFGGIVCGCTTFFLSLQLQKCSRLRLEPPPPKRSGDIHRKRGVEGTFGGTRL